MGSSPSGPAEGAGAAASGEGRRLWLLDGMALVYRGHFALIRNPRMSSRGVNTSAPFVFANTLLDIIGNQKPSHIAAVFDTPEPTRRHEEFPEYKGTRDAMPEDLSAAIPYVFRLCEAFNIPVLRAPGWEADDVIGTLARQAEGEGYTTYMVTPDKDFAQLVTPQTYMYKPGRQGGDAEVLGVPEILEQWQVERVDQVIDILGLMGDTSDNVPGVPGIGQKTAQKLIAEYGTVEGLLDHVDEIKGKRGQVLADHREQAVLSKHLVTIDLDAPLDCTPADLVCREPDTKALAELFVELEFNQLGKRVLGDDFEASPQLALGDEDSGDDMRTIADTDHEYLLVDTGAAQSELVSAIAAAGSFCFDLETTGLDPKTCEIIGLAVSLEPHKGFYVPLPGEREATVAALGEFRPLLEDELVEKVGHNLKFDVSTLLWHGIDVRGKLFDTMIAAFLAAPDLRRGMDYLSQALLGYRPIPISALIGEKGDEQRSMAQVPVDEVVEYAAEDADITVQLRQALWPQVLEKGQVDLFERVECPLIPVLARMEREGIRVDAEALHDLSGELAGQIEHSADRIEELAGEPFNLNSPSQMGNILFDKLKLDPNARRTQKSKQYKTDEQVLTRLAYHHEIAREILNYRLCTKLKSTYLDMLPGAIFPVTGRIHTHYDQAVAATGRMQSSNPNLQNIPVRTEQGREIRRAFVPRGPGYALLSADYSQIELRVIAAMSGDERMIEAFNTGEDIHAVTASRIFAVPQDEVTDDMRRQSKTVNFGIIYGISAFGLAERMDLSRAESASIIDQYLDEYRGVRKYMEEIVESAREHGYVQTMLGRRRYLRDINSRNAATRKGAERNAINSPIQGTAADMIKLAMTAIDAEQRKRGWKTRMLLQVHDELVFDLWLEEEEEVKAVVAEAMKSAIPMSVPIEVEMGIGDTWLDAHP